MTNAEAVTGSKNFVVVVIFGVFGRYVTNLRGTFVENFKKVQNNPTLMRIRNQCFGFTVTTFESGSRYKEK
jgi:hypothetical protein